MPRRKLQGITQSELSGRLGLNARQVRELTQRGMPRHQDGSYDFRLAFDWYIRFRVEDERKRRPAAEPEAGDELGNLTIREQRAKVLLKELELRRAEGRSVSTVLHRHRISALAQQFSAIIRSLPQYAPELVGVETMPEVTVILERIANEMLALARGEEEEFAATPAEDPAALDSAA